VPLLQASGGLIYHARAWRGGRGAWAPFHRAVRAWLAAWRPASQHLVLVGPSAGYALEAAFLARFERVTVLEPDPLARWLLGRRFPNLSLDFAAAGGWVRPGGFDALARRFDRAAVLFCNLLGQTLEGAPAGLDRQAWLAELAPALAGRDWASWHDLASTGRPPDRFQPLALPGAEPLEGLLARFWLGGELEIVDHDCAGVAPRLPRQYAFWTLRPGRYHLVEWVASPGRDG
jgi:hypothetical protein